MGAINNAFNQAAGALAGAGLAIKHAKETEESKINTADSSAIIARNQARAADEEYKVANSEAIKKGGLIDQLHKADVNRDKAEKEYIRAVNRKNGSPKTRAKKLTELDAARQAEYELKNKHQALRSMKKRAEEQIDYANKATEMALDAKKKFEKRWGGK